MTKQSTTAPVDEQEICVSCGFCCDNTLFEYASVHENDELYGHFKDTQFELENKPYFKLPCAYFKTCCTIYDQEKPNICGSFRCKLLKSFEKGEIDKQKALNIVQNAKELRKDIQELDLSVHQKTTRSFRSILKDVNTNSSNSQSWTILKAKSNLLSLLLIKYFKSKQSFDEFLSNNNEQ